MRSLVLMCALVGAGCSEGDDAPTGFVGSVPGGHGDGSTTTEGSSSATGTTGEADDTAVTTGEPGTTSGPAMATSAADETTGDGSTSAPPADTDTSTSETSGTTTTGTGGPGCNEMLGIYCGELEYCDYPDDLCGTGADGVCVAFPQDCPDEYEPVCGCDGASHVNSCIAAIEQTDVNPQGSC